MRLLTITNLYPSRDMPRHGIFVEERLRHLLSVGGVQAQVIALRPALPLPRGNEIDIESRIGIKVEYRRVPTLPKLSNWIDPWLWATAIESTVRQAIEHAGSGVILDAHFLYPDGVAAVILGERLGLPVVVTARGSDVNVKCENAMMRRWMRWAAPRTSAVITVSQALAERLHEHGIRPPVLEVIPNGVDLQKFRPRDREEGRRRFGVSGRVLASVGHLVDDKGHQLAVEALASLPDTQLLIAGNGPRRAHLERLAGRLGVADRVRFAGLVPHEAMPWLYSAVDALVLASAREGMPNVVLESIACGTRVIATDVGGVGEVIGPTEAGVLMASRSPEALLEALGRLEQAPCTRETTRKYAERFGWERMLDRQVALYQSVLGRRAA